MVTGIIVQGPGELGENWVTTCKVKYEKMVGAGDLVYITTDTGGNDKVVKVNKPYTLHDILELIKIQALTLRFKQTNNKQTNKNKQTNEQKHHFVNSSCHNLPH